MQGVLSKLGAAKELMKEVIARERKKAKERNAKNAEVRITTCGAIPSFPFHMCCQAF